jgi:hypothetical protein
MEGVMIRGRRMSRCWATRGRGMPPPIMPTPKESAPQIEGQTTEQEQVAVSVC